MFFGRAELRALLLHGITSRHCLCQSFRNDHYCKVFIFCVLQ